LASLIVSREGGREEKKEKGEKAQRVQKARGGEVEGRRWRGPR
jgi:hypothetical protein